MQKPQWVSFTCKLLIKTQRVNIQRYTIGDQNGERKSIFIFILLLLKNYAAICKGPKPPYQLKVL